MSFLFFNRPIQYKISLICFYLLFIFSFQNLMANPLLVENYQYPFTRPFQSTLALGVARPSTDNLDVKVLRFTLHPERSSISGIGSRNSAPVGYLQGDNPNSPMIILFPGLGGNALTPSILFLAELLNQKGFAVLTFSSSFSWQFALAVSSTGLPGHPKQDAADQYELIKMALQKVKMDYRLNPRSVSIIGYSLGGNDVSAILTEDLQKKAIGFKKILMLNPAFHSLDGVALLDQLLQPGLKYSPRYQEALLSQATGLITDFIMKPYTVAELEQKLSTIPYSEEQLSWLIGMNYRESLKNIIMVSQQVHDLGILKTPISERQTSQYGQEAAKYNFKDYFILFLKPSANAANANDIISNENFKNTILSWKNSDIKWAIFHNQNDFLWSTDILTFLNAQTSGSRIYPLGGHVGNLWIEQNQLDLLQFLN